MTHISKNISCSYWAQHVKEHMLLRPNIKTSISIFLLGSTCQRTNHHFSAIPVCKHVLYSCSSTGEIYEVCPPSSAVLTKGHTGQLPGCLTRIGAHANLCILCTACFNTDFVGRTNKINICVILIDNYNVTPLGGCVGRGPSALLCPGPIMLLRRSPRTTIYKVLFMNGLR